MECQWKRKKSDLPTTSAAAEMFPNIPHRPLSRLPNEEDRSFLYKELSAIGKFTGLFWIMSPEVPQQTPKTSAPLIDNVIKVVLEAKKDERPFLFKKLMAVDKLKIAAVNQETIGQRDNELWHSVRKGRLTASNFGAVINAKKFTPSLKKQLFGEYDLQGVKAVSWGISHEDDAIKQFCNETGKSVEKCGVWLDETGLLGASPDGIVNDENAILEIKCPFSIRDEFVLSGVSKSSFCLMLEGENFVLKKKHRYWHQVQGQLHLTGMDLCYFLVWTKKELITIKIKKDENWNTNLDYLRSFYMKYIYPEWCPDETSQTTTVTILVD